MDLSKEAQQILEMIEKMNAVEINGLVKALEEKFGVTASAMVVAWWWAAAWGEAWGDSDSVKVELTEIWQQKIAVIKAVKELMWLWLKEAKEIVEKAPVILKEWVKNDDAEWMKEKLEEAWATVSFK